MKMHGSSWKLLAAIAVVMIGGCATNSGQLGASGTSEDSANMVSADSLGAQMFNSTPKTADNVSADAN